MNGSSLRSRRAGLTLIELLLVCFIIVLFVGVAAPLLRPNTTDTKVREAARQLVGFIAEAQSYASQRQRPVGLVFDRAKAIREGGRNSNQVSRLYLAECPPIYSGDTLGVTVGIANITSPAPAPPAGFNEFPIGINGNPARLMELDFTALDAMNNRYHVSPMLEVILASYLPAGAAAGTVPISVRFNNKGPYYPGYAQLPHPNPPTAAVKFQCFVWTVYGQPMYYVTGGRHSFQIQFAPQTTPDSVLELPTGTIVDLAFSGYGMQGNEFFDGTSQNANRTILMFNPSGEIDTVWEQGGLRRNIPGRMFFLVSNSKRAIDATDVRTSTLNDRNGQWVSVLGRTGQALTSPNSGFDSDPPSASNMPVTPADPTYLPTALARARGFAARNDTTGGR
jgi:type II secretory pathway pseudopilin PulG